MKRKKTRLIEQHQMINILVQEKDLEAGGERIKKEVRADIVEVSIESEVIINIGMIGLIEQDTGITEIRKGKIQIIDNHLIIGGIQEAAVVAVLVLPHHHPLLLKEEGEEIVIEREGKKAMSKRSIDV